MTVFKKLLGYPLLGLGGLFLLTMVVVPLAESPDADIAAAGQTTTVVGGLIVGLPLSAAGGSLVLSAHNAEVQFAKTQSAIDVEQARLRHVLYQLIAASEGQVTMVQFAIAADISAVEASTYMNAQANAFSATFDITENGSMVYQFPIS